MFIIFFVIYLFLIFCPPRIDNYDFENVNVDEIYEKGNNGDLIFLIGDTYGERLCRSITRCPFSHVGILFRETNEKGKDILYVWESDLGQGYDDGPRVVELKNKLKKYKGLKFGGWRVLRGERPKTEDILNCIHKYIKYDFDNNMSSWFVSNISFLHDMVKYNDKVFCSELIAMTFQDLGILNKTKKPTWYSPGYFIMKKIPYCNSDYSNLKKFKFV